MADKLRTLQNLEALQARYIGTGHADTTKYEWTSNILRDSYASYVGHNPLLSYMSVGMGEPKEKVRVMMLEKMVRGAGNPPEVGAFSALKLTTEPRTNSLSFNFRPKNRSGPDTFWSISTTSVFSAKVPVPLAFVYCTGSHLAHGRLLVSQAPCKARNLVTIHCLSSRGE